MVIERLATSVDLGPAPPVGSSSAFVSSGFTPGPNVVARCMDALRPPALSWTAMPRSFADTVSYTLPMGVSCITTMFFLPLSPSRVVASIVGSSGIQYFDYVAHMKRGDSGAWSVSKVEAT